MCVHVEDNRCDIRQTKLKLLYYQHKIDYWKKECDRLFFNHLTEMAYGSRFNTRKIEKITIEWNNAQNVLEECRKKKKQYIREYYNLFQV
jgi:hypothetical protein